LISRIATAEQAASLIPSNATVAVTGSGGGVLEPAELFRAVRQRFDATGEPHGLTVVHALGIGHHTGRGLELWADPRLVRRVIGGHWSWSPTMQGLAADGSIEAYAWPSGVISLLLREIGARRPGLFTRTGLATFVDPRHGGGRCNPATVENLVDLVQVDGHEYLHYRAFPVDVGVIRGTYADELGNVSCREEAASLDVFAVATAAKASGGRVIAQVREIVERDRMDPRAVDVPGSLVDCVVVAPDQWQSYGARHDPAAAGLTRSWDGSADEQARQWSALPVHRSLIAGRAAAQSRPGDRINVGFGISADVVTALGARGALTDVQLLIEQGAIGGSPLGGDLFGVSRNFDALLPSTSQFDLFSSGVLDRAFLGMAEVDASGSVNVSMVGGRLVGPGGFIDISQYARDVVFCGTFTTRGLELAVEGDKLYIAREGEIRKFVAKLAHTTYSGPFAVRERRTATYVTERATFVLRPDGIELTEIVAGVDLHRDVLAHMDFTPIVRDPVTVAVTDYRNGLVGLADGRRTSASVGSEARCPQ
jgi:propionate CoA-transferase